ncbi:MAG: GNAT family N-acetyltransferase [Acidimicrobiia bacterium]
MESIVEMVVSSPSDPEAAALIVELNRFLDDLYHPDDNHFRLHPDEVSGDRGVFLVARIDGLAIGCGAVRLADDGRGEVKRMYVRPDAQRRGVGRLLLDRLSDHARELGATSLILEMGDSQPGARVMYESAGFAPIPCWGEYVATPASLCLGKEL